MEFAVDSGLDIGEHFYVRCTAGTRISCNIEATEQGHTVGAHAHDSVALSSGARRLGSIRGLCEVEAQFVDSFFERNVVAKASLA